MAFFKYFLRDTSEKAIPTSKKLAKITTGKPGTPGVSGGGVVPPAAGAVMVLDYRVTEVPASALPSSTAPVVIAIPVAHNMIPLKEEYVPSDVAPATCQKMFFANAPPAK